MEPQVIGIWWKLDYLLSCVDVSGFQVGRCYVVFRGV